MMLRPREVSYYYPLQDGVACKAVDRLMTQVDDSGSVHNLHHLIAKWILECKEVMDYLQVIAANLFPKPCPLPRVVND